MRAVIATKTLLDSNDKSRPASSVYAGPHITPDERLHLVTGKAQLHWKTSVPERRALNQSLIRLCYRAFWTSERSA
jgi:hypothetical protein